MSNFFGISIPFAQLRDNSSEEVTSRLRDCRRNGMRLLRTDWYSQDWHRGFGEQERVYEIANKLGITICMLLNGSAGGAVPWDGRAEQKEFAAYAEAASANWKGRIRIKQIGNEFNVKGVDFSDCVTIHRLASRAIRQAAPDSYIISGGLTPVVTSAAPAIRAVDYLAELYKFAGYRDTHDAIGIHYYSFRGVLPSAESPDVDGVPQGGWGTLMRLAQISEQNDDAKPIAITEFGVSTGGRPDSTTEARHVEIINDAMRLCRQSARGRRVRSIYHYTYKDTKPPVGMADSPYFHEGLWREDRTPKPAVERIRQLSL